MYIKRKVRELMQKVAEKHGYTMQKIEDTVENKLGTYSLITNGQYVPFDEEAFAKRDENEYVVNWVIPPLGPGSGGHLDIFRAIGFLTEMGK